ncbi:MAG TPA: HdeD family acid-resistance protein [Streptosporangiaceae bacterium]|nr:HdeD family acid-resistance protein [Streptosporangiaceae bacterium]
MSPGSRRDAADWVTSLGRHWGWLLGFGILSLAVGVIAVAWPGPTVIAIAVLFGIQLIVAGIFQFVNAFAASDESGGVRVLYAVLGLFAFIIGLYAVRHVLVSVVALALLLGIFWIVNGFSEIFNALAHRDTPHRGWTGFIGVLSILAGIVVLVYPGISLVTLALVLGIWLIIYGVMEIAMAFRVRSSVGRIRHAVTNPV